MLNLFESSQAYFEKAYKTTKSSLGKYKAIYYFLSVFLLTVSSGVTIINVLVVAELFWEDYPTQYYYLTSAVAGVTIFFTSLLNFFFVKEKIEIKKVQLQEMEKENYKYTNALGSVYNKKNENKSWDFYLKILSILKQEWS